MPVKPSTVTTEEAREAAWTEYEAGAEWEPRDRFAARDNFAHGFDAGVAAGIRQAREAVEATGPTWHRGMYGAPDDMYAHIAIMRAFESLAAIDALGGDQ